MKMVQNQLCKFNRNNENFFKTEMFKSEIAVLFFSFLSFFFSSFWCLF